METVWNVLQRWMTGPLTQFLGIFVFASVIMLAFHVFFRSRKIQPNGFKWKTLRNEIIFGLINISLTGLLLGGLSSLLNHFNLIHFNHEKASWGVIALEYVAYFFLFDTWFYWFHRLMHVEPIYTVVHKLHHFSTSPNILTTLSVNPLESLVNGGFVPIFTALLTVHDQTMMFVLPTNIVMGLYVHAGYEFLPRWWNKTWFSRWFITTTFHDQHHKYFNWNFGGYTVIWDFICGTVRPKYIADFDQVKARAGVKAAAPELAAAE